MFQAGGQQGPQRMAWMTMPQLIRMFEQCLGVTRPDAERRADDILMQPDMQWRLQYTGSQPYTEFLVVDLYACRITHQP